MEKSVSQGYSGLRQLGFDCARVLREQSNKGNMEAAIAVVMHGAELAFSGLIAH